MNSRNANSLIILDFETTGLSPDMGDRAIEIGAVRIDEGVVTGTFQELMHPGFPISGFIEDYTGITNAMLQDASPCEDVMARFANFIGDSNLVAHNASFDKRFLDAEFRHIGHHYAGEFACSLLIARRLYQDAPNHKLGTLIQYKHIPSEGTYHRALYDSEMTTKLWMAMISDISEHYDISPVPFSLIQTLAKTPKKSVQRLLNTYTHAHTD